MLEILEFIKKQKVGNIILVCIFVIPYISWIIWFIGKNILTLAAWIAYKTNENRREIKTFAKKIRHYVWTFYNNIYIALLAPFVVFCIRWDNFNRYISEIITIAGLISLPMVIYFISIIRGILSNLLEGCIHKMNVFAGDMKRSTRNIFVYFMTLFLMPVLGFCFMVFILVIPLFVAWTYGEWVVKLVRIIRRGKSAKHTKDKQKKQLILYKYRSLDNWNKYRNVYLAGKLHFANRESLNDPAENISLADRSAARIEADRPVSKRENVNNDPLDEYKICSMTANPNNYVMWTNYAEEHKGVCIGFIIDLDILKKEAIECKKVIYAKYLPVIENFVYPYDFETDDFKWTDTDIRKLIFYKLDKWKYEDEWRLVKMTDKPSRLSRLNRPSRLSRPNKLSRLSRHNRLNKPKKPNRYNRHNKPNTWQIGKAVRILCGYKCTPHFVNQLRKELDIPVEQVTFERSKKGVSLHVPGDDADAFGYFSNTV